MAVIDGGADTCVLGQGWRFISLQTGRKATLCGFDPSHTSSTGHFIGSLCTVMCDNQGKDILAIIHNGFINTWSPITLLSANQMRYNHLIVDDVSKFCRSSNRGMGKQQIVISPKRGQDPVIIPLKL